MEHNMVEVKLYPNTGKLCVRYVGDVLIKDVRYIPIENSDKSLSVHCTEDKILNTIQYILTFAIDDFDNKIYLDTVRMENLRNILKSYTTGYPGQEEILEKCERLCEGISISDSKSPTVKSDDRRKRVDVTKLVL